MRVPEVPEDALEALLGLLELALVLDDVDRALHARRDLRAHQATDRAHRIGQTRVVSVYKLVAKGTVEEKFLQLAAKKRALVDTILTEHAGPTRTCSVWRCWARAST